MEYVEPDSDNEEVVEEEVNSSQDGEIVPEGGNDMPDFNPDDAPGPIEPVIESEEVENYAEHEVEHEAEVSYEEENSSEAGEKEYLVEGEEEASIEEKEEEQEDVDQNDEMVHHMVAGNEASYPDDENYENKTEIEDADQENEEYVGEGDLMQQEEIPNQEEMIESVEDNTEAAEEIVQELESAETVEQQENIQEGQEHEGDLEEDSNESSAQVPQAEEVFEDSREVEEEEGQPEEIKNDSEEEDFDNVVEVEEHKAEDEAEDENIAQHVSDSENEEDEGKTEEVKLGDVSEDDLRGASSSSENEASDAEISESPNKKRAAVLSSDEEDEAVKEKRKHEAAMKMFDSDSDHEQKEDGVGDLIADIFGESDDEGEEFTGFGQEEIGKKKSEKAKSSAISDDSEDDEPPREFDDEGYEAGEMAKKTKVVTKEEDSDSDEGVGDGRSQAMSDFDIMLAKKKEENRRHRRRRDGGTFISDADDIINAMLTKMKDAAEADRDANQNRKPALKKLKMLPSVIAHLKKQNLKEAFVDNGVIAAIADWLSLLPDRSLPHITIRTELLKVLHDLPSVGPETLKHSGIGKAVMILFKHPKEVRQNKESAGRLINKWSRPIFGLNENFKSMSREEREQRDLDQMPQAKRRRLSSGAHRNQSEEGRGEGELGHLRPGEVGFVMRARVPMPSTKDYVVRPKWNVDTGNRQEEEEEPGQIARRRRSAGAPRSSKKDERLEKHIRNFAERKKNSKLQRAVKISIEGNKMSIA